ncbi:FAD dependent oxidoreductase domain-containing protein [Pochonia chlamydosporia 170]|uniref:FAD dependent oxidoreductase domain-containing protein n=1 Tax=Pochonia chlamydosporia 170 TaxID=1380566 RepID=A0A179F472_METCM|nr:FAD dependent oxidoreductase domain-containing protein [Pochonia chlamydosporia 170]OAQ59983.1 FAD dependent oxidoreductase domain-containing protein [Pochonia chlamydosporia 170]
MAPHRPQRGALPCHLFNLANVFISILALTSLGAAMAPSKRAVENRVTCDTYGRGKYDVLIYGATPAGLAAAIQTKRMNKTVAIVTPSKHIGGLTVSGLGWTDSKDGNAIGGIAREFYHRVYQHYKSDAAWRKGTRADYIKKQGTSQPGPTIDDEKQVQWTFEPHIAQMIFENWVKDLNIKVFRNETVDRSSGGVKMKDKQIVSFKTVSGHVYDASVFIDASYEGDLMAAAGIGYRIGRESEAEFKESLAGVRISPQDNYLGMDPYIKKGKPSSGLIKGIDRAIPAGDVSKLNGTADKYRLQSFNYRLCLTQDAGNRVPFSKPKGYDEASYEILLRYIESGYHDDFFTKQLMPNGKTDSNSNGHVSTDLLGGNYDADKHTNYIEQDYEQRAEIVERHKTYTQGFFWTLANHPRVPERFRKSAGTWGYAKDEFVSNDHWPFEIYIREARRLKGKYTMTQSDVQSPKIEVKERSIGLGSYTLDVHEVERVVINNKVHNEGLIHVPVSKPFPIPFDSIIAPTNVATNFLSPVTMSSTHVAFASIRMEPTYMILGQSAATAAVLAIEECSKIQDVDIRKLAARLREDKQVLDI